MKSTIKTIFASFVMGAILIVGCKPYDDSALTGRVDDLEGRVTKLEKLVKDLNTNVNTLSAIVRAMEEENRIEWIRPLEDGTGYTIKFTNLGEMVIKNGDKPSIGVEKDETTGIYYWTVDGEPMMNGTDRIPATIAPEFKTEDGKLYFRINGGEWTLVEGADKGIGLIQEVIPGEEDVTFVLADGQTIVIPTVQAFRLNIDISEAGIFANSSVSIPYTIIAGDSETKVAAIAGSGYQASVSGNYDSGTITITAPAEVPEVGYVIVMAVNGKGVQSSKILTFEQGELKVAKDTYTIGAQGGEIQIELQTNVEFMTFKDPNPQYDWLTIVETPVTKALRDVVLTLSAAKYEGGTAPRTATVKVLYGSESKDITVTQLHTDIVSGGKADFENFGTNPGRFTTLISDKTTGGWELKNGYLRQPTGVTPPAASKHPALCASTEATGTLTSPELEGGCGILTISLAGAKLESFVPNGIKINVEIKQGENSIKTLPVEIPANEYVQKVVVEKNLDINVAGNFQIIITNGCPSGLTGTKSTNEDAYITAVSWTGYSE